MYNDAASTGDHSGGLVLQACTAYSTMALVCGLLGVVAETVVSLLRVHSQPTETVALPEFGMPRPTCA